MNEGIIYDYDVCFQLYFILFTTYWKEKQTSINNYK